MLALKSQMGEGGGIERRLGLVVSNVDAISNWKNIHIHTYMYA